MLLQIWLMQFPAAANSSRYESFEVYCALWTCALTLCLSFLLFFGNNFKLITSITLSEFREIHFCENLYIDWIYKIIFYFICGKIKLYIAYNTYVSLIGIHMQSRSDAKYRVGTYEFAEPTNEGWDFIRSSYAAVCIGTQEVVPLYVCIFPFVVAIWYCAYGKQVSEYSDVSFYFNLNQTAWRWQRNLWSSIYLDFRFS